MESKTVFVSSENRDTSIYPSGNSYTLHLSESIKNVVSVELLHASVPNTLYNVSDDISLLSVSNVNQNGHISDPSLLYDFAINSGFYGAVDLASEITNTMSNISGVVVTYLASEGKFLFARNALYGAFSMHIGSGAFSELLGFSSSGNTLLNSETVSYNGVDKLVGVSDNQLYRNKQFIKSQTVINMTVNRNIFLDIHELRSVFNQDAKAIDGDTTSGATMSRSFGIIPLDVPSGGIKIFNSNTDYPIHVSYPRVIGRLDRLTVKWVDRNGKGVSFNGVDDNSFVLKIHSHRRNTCP